MLHLEYRNNEYNGSLIDITPARQSDIPELRDMVTHKMVIENPAKTFAAKFKAGGYDMMPEEEVAYEAEMANILSELWDAKANMNTMMILSRALQMIIDLKKDPDGYDEYEDFEDSELNGDQ